MYGVMMTIFLKRSSLMLSTGAPAELITGVGSCISALTLDRRVSETRWWPGPWHMMATGQA